MPMSCSSVPLSLSLCSRALVPAHPHGSVRSEWKCIDRRMAERASGPVFPLAASLGFPQSSPPLPVPLTAGLAVSASPRPEFPSFPTSHLPRPSSRSLSSSPLKHTFRVFPPPRMALSPFCLFRPLRYPSSLDDPPGDDALSSLRRPFTLTTHAALQSAPSAPPKREKIFMPMYRFAVAITARNPRARLVSATGVAVRVSHTRVSSIRFPLTAVRVRIPLRSIVNRFRERD